MRKRIITYDVKEGNDYSRFYELIENNNGKMITESTYELETNWSQDEFVSKVANVFNRGDKIYYISIDKDNKLFYNKIKV